MPENPRIKLPFGDALDRESGLMVMRPGSMEDLRNVVLHEGAAVVRAGFGSELALTDDEGVAVSHVVQGHALRSDRIGIVVSYQAVTERVFVHRIDPDGTMAEYIGEWVNDQDGAWGDTPPVVCMDESYGKVFMAHDERFITHRAPTIYYDSTDGQLHDLENEFVPVTESEGAYYKTRFRGVVRWLNYLVGWGYGTDIEDRPELVRISLPGEPTSFNKDHWIIIGNRRDPVLLCVPCGDRLGVLKDAEGYPMVGTSRADFGAAPAPVDPRFGLIVGALAVNYGGMVMAWSAEGPRLWDFQGASRDVAMPLDLRGPQPATLVAQGETKYAFACYIPTERIVAFVFGRRVYAFSVRNEESPKWAGYWELATEAYCAFTLYTGGQLTGAPEGYPVWVSEVPAGAYVDVAVNNFDHDGDETLEVWLSEDGGDWYLARSTLVSPGQAQTPPVRVPGPDGTPLSSATDYEGALRHRRGLLVAATHQDANPENWLSVSLGSFTTTIDPPAPVSAVWSRTGAATERIRLTVTPAVGLEADDIEVFRDGVSIGTISGPHAGNAIYDDTACAGETLESYTFVTNGGGGDSPPSDPITCWAGPAGVPAIEWAQPIQNGSYEIGVTLPAPTLSTEMWDNYDNAGGIGSYALRETEGPGVATINSGTLTGVPDSPLYLDIGVKVRLKSTVSGTDDFGQYSAVTTVGISEVP